MIDDARNARRFGAHDKPPCANCGKPTFLTRRSPAAEHALEYERQTFTCPGCGREFERVVDADGKATKATAIELALARN
jgi:transposase-like protein